jgi:anti-anti-sigma regulatory factor
MEMDGVKAVVFDLTTVRTITSSGIGKIMNFFKFIDGRKGSMSIKGISEQLYKQFMEIHLDRIFPMAR